MSRRKSSKPSKPPWRLAISWVGHEDLQLSYETFRDDTLLKVLFRGVAAVIKDFARVEFGSADVILDDDERERLHDKAATEARVRLAGLLLATVDKRDWDKAIDIMKEEAAKVDWRAWFTARAETPKRTILSTGERSLTVSESQPEE